MPTVMERARQLRREKVRYRLTLAGTMKDYTPLGPKRKRATSGRKGSCPVCGPGTRYHAAVHNDCFDYLKRCGKEMRDALLALREQHTKELRS